MDKLLGVDELRETKLGWKKAEGGEGSPSQNEMRGGGRGVVRGVGAKLGRRGGAGVLIGKAVGDEKTG
jgi:hypothetical protein